MNALATTRTLHPLQWVALVSVTLFSLAGIGAITGLIPSSKSTEAPLAPLSSAPSSPAATDTPIAETAQPVIESVKQAPEEPVAVPQPKTVKRPAPTVKPHSTQVARTEQVNLPTEAPPPALCYDCGRIESIQRIERNGEGSGVGAAAGGVLGGVLGHNVGNGRGQTVATIAGVIGGAMLGNHVEKTNKKTVSYQTTVRLDDGSTRVFENPSEQGLYEGERIRVVNGAIQPL